MTQAETEKSSPNQLDVMNDEGKNDDPAKQADADDKQFLWSNMVDHVMDQLPRLPAPY